MKQQQQLSSTSSTSSCPQKLLHVESDSLRLTDHQHEEMDMSVLNYPLIPAIKSLFTYFALPLLTSIVCEADGLLNQEYAFPGPAKRLIDKNPQLMGELEAAFEEQKFAQI